MSELFAELQEDMRQERLQKLWNSFGKVMVAISLVVILITIVVVTVESHRRSVAMRQTSQFMSAIDRLSVEDYKGAIALFSAMAEDESSPYYGMAMLHKAEAEEASGNKDAAEKTYAALASHDQVFGALAALRLTGKQPEPDRNSPFYYTLLERQAWQLVQENGKDKALKLFTDLRDDNNAPSSLRERANEALQYLSPLPEAP